MEVDLVGYKLLCADGPVNRLVGVVVIELQNEIWISSTPPLPSIPEIDAFLVGSKNHPILMRRLYPPELNELLLSLFQPLHDQCQRYLFEGDLHAG